MQPYWQAWAIVLAIALVVVIVYFVRREYRRRPVATQEAGPMALEARIRERVHRSMVPAPGPQLPDRTTWQPRGSMKIYLVTVADNETIANIGRAIDAGVNIYIGDARSHGPISEIQEYVNVDS
jgi:hypothetical protein